MHDIFEGCSSSCGFLAAFISCLCFGSFCVPMKSEAARKLDVDPLVFQTYKTFMCFISSFVVLLLGVERLTFTAWGIVSGVFWVPGGVAHVCGVRTAGLAISQGTSSSIIVLVAFWWGIFVFEERVKSVTWACLSVVVMIVGIVGMSYFSAPSCGSSNGRSAQKNYLLHSKKAAYFRFSIPTALSNAIDFIASSYTADEAVELVESMESDLISDDSMDVETQTPNTTPKKLVRHSSFSSSVLQDDTADKQQNEKSKSKSNETSSDSSTPLDNNNTIDSNEEDCTQKDILKKLRLQKNNGAYAIVSSCAYHLKAKYNIDLSIRQTGLCFSAAGAVWGGSVLVPLHFAGDEAKGLSYVFSFAVGASFVNIVLWIARYHHLYRSHGNSHVAAWHSLPCFHIQTMALPGALSGLLYSIGNICSILSVTYLGEGVGYSMTQSAMLVSGMWGIFWFHEITTIKAIRGWMASACLAIAGILLLSYNHMPPPPKPMLKG